MSEAGGAPISPLPVDELPPLKRRPADGHKGTFGKALIAAGSPFMPGAPVLAARAAYRSGCGLVTVLTDLEAIPSVAAGVVEAVFTDWPAIGEKLAVGEPIAADAMLVGPGMGTRDRGRLVFDLIRAAAFPTVLDADALNLIAEHPEVSLPRRHDRIWTPHPGEFRRLTGISPKGDAERLEASHRFVDERGGVVVLKGRRSVVLDASRYAINQSGNSGMATAGSGDVLSGILVSLLAQGYPPFEAARLGVHLHGLAGDLAAAALGERSIIAGDLVSFLSAAFQRHLEARGESP
jgi:NAD(P)H-hydrate epimerase